jgi:ribosomal protein S6--L-glutamate ligase
MAQNRILMLGGGPGWHADQLSAACSAKGIQFETAGFESLRSRLGDHTNNIHCSAGELESFDVVMVRTMPAASLDRITFRLACLHHLQRNGITVINAPAALEIAIDKFATLSVVASLGYPIPETSVVQSRSDAITAFAELGGDCVIKPIFGGEGRGVMRVCSPELADTAFSTLDRLGATLYLQRFVPPGGCDIRLLTIGENVIALRRTNSNDFRTNRSFGGSVTITDATAWQQTLARDVCHAIGLTYGSVDLIDDPDGNDGYRVVEVNAIPGWKAAQSVCDHSIAEQVIDVAMNTSSQVMHV